MARVLVPGALTGIAICLIAYFVIGGIPYSLLNGSKVATLAGTLSATVLGAALGALTVYTSTKRDTAVMIRGAAAGAFIGVVGGFLGSIDTMRLEGIDSNVALISLAAGAAVGVAGLRGAGGRFFGTRADDGEKLDILGRALDGTLAGVIIGVLCAVPVTKFNSSIFIFLRKIDPARRMSQDNSFEFVNVLSIDELLIGAVLGVVVGLVVGLVLSRERTDRLLNGMLIGVSIGLVWSLPHIIVMTFNESLGGVLGSEVLWGALAMATVAGAVISAALPGFRLTAPWRLALVGGGIGVLFVLPYVVFASAYILDGRVASSSRTLEQGMFQTFLTWNRTIPVRLLIGAVSGAAVCLILSTFMNRYVGVALNVLAVTIILLATTLGLKGRYFLFLADLYLFGSRIDLPSFVYGFSGELLSIPIGVAINSSFGVISGLIFAVVIKLAASRPNPDRILPDQSTT